MVRWFFLGVDYLHAVFSVGISLGVRLFAFYHPAINRSTPVDFAYCAVANCHIDPTDSSYRLLETR